jgi:ABC-type nitrate/sulfonate/bicarbonate transport system permease component
MTAVLDVPLEPAVAGAPVLDEGSFDFAGERHRRRRAKLHRLGVGALGLALAISLWEIVALVVGNQVEVPTVQGTVGAFFHYLDHPYPSGSDPLWEDALVSTERILIGFAIGTTAGVALGSLMYAVRAIRHLVDPIIEVTRPLPPLAFIPVLIMWFGIGQTPKVVLIVIGVLPIMVVSTLAALDSVPKELEQCARTLGASRSYTLWHVQVRAALPAIMTGMRISMAASWTSIVAAEMIAANSGLGYVILQAGNYLQTPLVFAGIATIGAVGMALDLSLRTTLRWVDPSRR